MIKKETNPFVKKFLCPDCKTRLSSVTIERTHTALTYMTCKNEKCKNQWCYHREIQNNRY